jgi:hypothetical protein
VLHPAPAKHRQTFLIQKGSGVAIFAAMRSGIRHPRPHRHNRTALPGARPTRVARVVTRTHRAKSGRRALVDDPEIRQRRAEFYLDPYLDYGRFLTADGGVLIVYKDIDERFRHTIWRVCAWLLFTGLEWRMLFQEPPIHTLWLKLVCLIVVGVLNWLIVRKPVELYRRIEIRPDCMILDGYDVFWTGNLESGMPAFRAGEDGTFILSGIYGTRFIDFLTVRKFDDNDRMPEVMAGHLQQAMTQLWTRES